jgi:hypothetical protein
VDQKNKRKNTEIYQILIPSMRNWRVTFNTVWGTIYVYNEWLKKILKWLKHKYPEHFLTAPSQISDKSCSLLFFMSNTLRELLHAGRKLFKVCRRYPCWQRIFSSQTSLHEVLQIQHGSQLT